MKTRPSRPSPRIRSASGAGSIRSRRIRPGSSPGTVVFVGEQRLARVQIDVLHYDAEGWS